MEILIHTENDEIVVDIEGSGLPYKVGDTIYLNIDDDGKITRGIILLMKFIMRLYIKTLEEKKARD